MGWLAWEVLGVFRPGGIYSGFCCMRERERVAQDVISMFDLNIGSFGFGKRCFNGFIMSEIGCSGSLYSKMLGWIELCYKFPSFPEEGGF